MVGFLLPPAPHPHPLQPPKSECLPDKKLVRIWEWIEHRLRTYRELGLHPSPAAYLSCDLGKLINPPKPLLPL